MDKLIPGTRRCFTNADAFKSYKELIELTDGLSLSQVCSISNLDPAVVQNWVKRGYVSRPIKKKYHEKQLARILMINSLRGAMRIEDIGNLMRLINGDVEDESDDLLSEEELFGTFSNVIYELDDYGEVKKTIDSVLNKNKLSNEKLSIALEIMVNAYIASEHRKISRKYFKELEEYEKERKC